MGLQRKLAGARSRADRLYKSFIDGAPITPTAGAPRGAPERRRWEPQGSEVMVDRVDRVARWRCHAAFGSSTSEVLVTYAWSLTKVAVCCGPT